MKTASDEKKILRLRRFRGSVQDDSEQTSVILNEVKDLYKSDNNRL